LRKRPFFSQELRLRWQDLNLRRLGYESGLRQSPDHALFLRKLLDLSFRERRLRCLQTREIVQGIRNCFSPSFPHSFAAARATVRQPLTM
jgi:hypothetical protein